MKKEKMVKKKRKYIQKKNDDKIWKRDSRKTMLTRSPEKAPEDACSCPVIRKVLITHDLQRNSKANLWLAVNRIDTWHSL